MSCARCKKNNENVKKLAKAFNLLVGEFGIVFSGLSALAGGALLLVVGLSTKSQPLTVLAIGALFCGVAVLRIARVEE